MITVTLHFESIEDARRELCNIPASRLLGGGRAAKAEDDGPYLNLSSTSKAGDSGPYLNLSSTTKAEDDGPYLNLS